MFEFERLQGAGGKGIALQTRTGRDIRNMAGVELSETHHRRYAVLVRNHPNWQPRRPPSGEYNCAGHVWASRRTCIYDEDDWRLILREDGYRHVPEPVADDLVMYIDNGEILHLGRVLELRPGVAEGARPFPWVVSKWNDYSGEVCHFAHDHPYSTFGFNASIEFWTDRPMEIGN